MLQWLSIQILVNSKIFKLLLNLSLTHLRTQIACFQLKGDLIPVMLKELFHNSLQGLILYGKPLKRDWVAKNVFPRQVHFRFMYQGRQ